MYQKYFNLTYNYNINSQLLRIFKATLENVIALTLLIKINKQLQNTNIKYIKVN